MNARQKRLFEESLKKNPNLKMPSASAGPRELTDEDMALLNREWVTKAGDRSTHPPRPESTALKKRQPNSKPGLS